MRKSLSSQGISPLCARADLLTTQDEIVRVGIPVDNRRCAAMPREKIRTNNLGKAQSANSSESGSAGHTLATARKTRTAQNAGRRRETNTRYDGNAGATRAGTPCSNGGGGNEQPDGTMNEIGGGLLQASPSFSKKVYSMRR